MGRARSCPPYAIWAAEGAPLLVYIHELVHVLLPLMPEEWVHQAAETCCGLRQSCDGLNRDQLLAALRWMARSIGIAEAA